MAGFRDFQTGEVLTAANVNDFLAKQAVMKFADATARDTALGTAVGGGNALREGMVAYLDDTDEVLAYDGTAWGSVGLPLGTATPTDGQILAFGTATSTWNPTDGGKLVAVKHALFTGTQSNSTAAGAGFDVTDLSITHTMADATNQLIISAYIGILATAGNRARAAMLVVDGSTPIGAGAAASNRARVTAGAEPTASGSTVTGQSPAATFVYAPGDTASHTYKVQVVNLRSSTQLVYVNQTVDDSDLANIQRTSSGLVIQEVKV